MKDLEKRFEFRDIRPEEYDRAAEIEQIVFPPNEAAFPDDVREQARVAPECFMVAVDRENREIAGFLNGIATDENRFRDEFFTDKTLHDPHGTNVMLLGLDVLPEYQGQGLGREIMRQFCMREQAKGRKSLILTCLPRLVEMYEKFGYTDLGMSDSTWGGEIWHEMKIMLKKGEKVMNRAFSEIKGHLGFGMMRLPMKGDAIDNETACAMVDRFIDSGFNYFDTAHGYHDGKSEIAVRECLTSRHDRSEYLLTDKLTDEYFKSEEDIRPLIQLQLDTCGVEYFDFLLMHAQNAKNFEFFRKCRAYETAFDLKKEGKVRHVGLSFHDRAEVLDHILNEYPEIEIVQIQFNYLDYESAEVQSRKVYEVCRKHNKPVLIMEPVRGGNLVKLPDAAQKVLDDLRAETGSDCSNAGYALRFAAGFEGIEVVLSGMSNMEQMEDNLKTFSAGGEEGYIPFTDREYEAVGKVAAVFNDMGIVPCTQCRYCIEENHCPMEIQIPSLFSSYNRKTMFDEVLPWMTYEMLTSDGHGKASDCIECGMCESVCPQHIEIREWLKNVAEKFE